jgi:hypothetical protein
MKYIKMFRGRTSNKDSPQIVKLSFGEYLRTTHFLRQQLDLLHFPDHPTLSWYIKGQWSVNQRQEE